LGDTGDGVEGLASSDKGSESMVIYKSSNACATSGSTEIRPLAQKVPRNIPSICEAEAMYSLSKLPGEPSDRTIPCAASCSALSLIFAVFDEGCDESRSSIEAVYIDPRAMICGGKDKGAGVR
jgi:hypothetical protein